MERHRCGPHARVILCSLLGAACCLSLSTASYAQDVLFGQDILRVEEDWELRVDNPDHTTSGPQVTCAMSPTGDLDGTHGTFDLNHRATSAAPAGGYGVSVWHGESHFASCGSDDQARLARPGEQVTWTQRMEIAVGGVAFEIVNGQSTTWGTFGGGPFNRVVVDSPLLNLNGYDPTVSLENSGVGFAANRVNSVTLRAVRIYTADGQVYDLAPGLGE